MNLSRNRSRVFFTTLTLFLGVLDLGWGLSAGEANTEKSHTHTAVDCGVCHKMQARTGQTADPIADQATLPNSGSCLGCHQQNGPASQGHRLFHEQANPNCLSCHTYHDPDQLRIGDKVGSVLVAQEAMAVCENCHIDGSTPEVSQGHRLAGMIMHGEIDGKYAAEPSEFCLACHNRDGQLPFDARELTDFPRFHVQASHLFGIEVVPGYLRPGSTLKLQDKIPSDIVLINGRIECQTCHSPTSSESYLLSKSIEAGLCTDCHDLLKEPAPKLALSSQ